MKKPSILRVALLLQILFLFAGALSAQVDTGQVSGTVTDMAGALVPGAAVKITNTATGLSRSVTSNKRGEYLLSSVPVGPYTITVSALGFGGYTAQVAVAVGGHLTVDAKLGVQSTTIAVDVTAGIGDVSVNTTDSEIGQVIDSKEVKDLPSLTRNPYDFIVLTGSVNTDPNGSTANGVGYSLSGTRAASTEILLDGVENVNLYSATVGQTIPLDGVNEFSVITGGLSAEYGRATGGVVNLVSNAGTNNYHGSLYEFNRVSALASNTYYEDSQDASNEANGLPINPRDHFTENRFGYSIGGRLYPPLHDKLFFFSSTEWNRVRSSGQQPFVVPTASFISQSSAATQAFFKQYGTLGSYASVGQTIAVPGYTGAGDPLEVATVTVPINAGAGSPTNAYDSLDRVDYTPTNKTNMFFRYGIFRDSFFAGSNSLSPYNGYNTGSNDLDQAALASITHIFQPTLVLSTKFAYNRLTTQQPLGTAPVGPTLYLNNTATESVDTSTNIPIALPGYLPLSPGDAIPFGGPQNFYQVQPDLTWTIKTHTLHLGGSYIQLRDNRTFGAYENAIQQIDPNGTTEGQALNDLSAGNVYSFQVAVNPQGKYPCFVSPTTGQTIQTSACTINLPVTSPVFTRENTFNDIAAYAQDDWKLTPRLTVNLGIRWEFYGVQHNTNQGLDSNFYPSTGGNAFQNIENGSVQIAPQSPIHSLIARQYHNFGPRIGFAYDVFGDGKWSARGGYGIAYERNFGNVTYNVLFNPPAYAVIDQVETSAAAPLSLTNNNFGPLAATSGSAALPQPELRALDPHLKTAYTNLYDLSLEHQLRSGMVLGVEYTGTRGIHQYSIAPENTPFYGNEYLGDTYAGGARINQQYAAINVRESNGDGYYNGLNVRFRDSNFSRQGLELVSNYTLSHTLDNLSSTFSQSGNNFNLGYVNGFTPALDRGNSDYDIRQRVTLGAVYEPKFLEFEGNKLLHSTIGGLEFAPILTAESGPHFTVYDCSNILGYACPRIEPAADVHYHAKPKNISGPNSPDSFQLQQVPLDSHDPYYNTLVDNGVGNTPSQTPYGPFVGGGGSEIPTCSVACSQNVGMGRNQFSAPNIWNLDMGVYKNFHITHRYIAQFRGEFYNIFNHHNIYEVPGNADYAELTPETQDANGNSVPSAATGPGYVAGLKGTPAGNPSASDERRQVQLALRLTF